MKGIVLEQSPIDRTDVVDSKDKKKKRRSKRTKQVSSVPACSSVNEVSVETSDVAFISLPTMHINETLLPQEPESTQNQEMYPSDYGGKILSEQCQESNACEASLVSNLNKDDPLLHHTEYHAQKKYFASHWSTDSVTAALGKGIVFKSLFRVNAHNRLEAYCKIDGVPTDVLINGIASQNRAVEGDIVAIKIDPLSLWTRMRGSTGNSNVPTAVDDSNLINGGTESVHNNYKGKNKLDADCEYNNYRNDLHENASPEFELPNDNIYANGKEKSLLDPSLEGSSSEIQTAVEKLCALINSFPSKRPTGKVVAVIDISPRRDAVVGYLSVKQWIFSSERYKKSAKKNKLALSNSNLEHIPLTPTDPKFPKMMVPMRSLPDSIKKRLNDLDPTVEMELVAARIVDWDEEFEVPQADVMHIFGRGGEVEPQITAILFENAIRTCEFSPETLSCIPCEVSRDEFQSRRDLTNLCVFTIDPSTATDLDDALSVDLLPNGIYRVGVHIADVSYYVLPGTHIDEEARIRSTSVYLTQRKLPMLPPLLSGGIGSLNPGADRLAFSIFWDISPSGEVLDRWIGRTVIRSCCKLSYENAQEIIDDTLEDDFPHLHGHFEHSDVIKAVKILHKISQTLKESRFRSGALSLENPKVGFLFDEDGIPYNTMLSGQKDSNFLVEEFMLLANCTAAEVISRAYPSSALLRRHPEPNLRKLREFEAFCNKHGLDLDTSSSGRFRQSLECIKKELKNDSVLFDILMSYAIKPMQLATYFCSGDLKDTESEWGHYALAVPLYTHFTSPLRRYPDIVVHRTLAATIEAEEMYLKKRALQKLTGEKVTRRCFTGLEFDRDAVESIEAKESINVVSSKHKLLGTDILAGVAAYCNERRLASRHVKDATDKLYMWVLLRNKEILFSEARVLGLGPRFMSIYIQKLAIERRIYYDEVEGLMAEWLDSTSTLILSLCTDKRFRRRGSPCRFRALDEVALLTAPSNLISELDFSIENNAARMEIDDSNDIKIEPFVFPLTVRLLSTIPVALHAIGGDDGPLDIGARLYVSSYFS